MKCDYDRKMEAVMESGGKFGLVATIPHSAILDWMSMVFGWLTSEHSHRHT